MTPANRSKTIDILRGFAIFTMVAADLSADFLREDLKVFAFRCYGSFAAAFFVTLAGMMVVLSMERHNNASHYLKRGGLLILCAASLDGLIWDKYPFLSFDVLYLIAIALPLVYLSAKRCSFRQRSYLTAALVIAAPLLQNLFHYRLNIFAPDIGKFSMQAYATQLFSLSTLRSLFIDGWFPLVPWLGFAMLGSLFGSLRERFTLASKELPISGLLVFCLGVFFWYWQNTVLAIRLGYSELFYPPTIAYFLTATGYFLLLLYGIEKTQNFKGYSILNKLGQSSLFMYILHYLIISNLEGVEKLKHLPFAGFLLLYALLIVVMLALGQIFIRLKQKYVNN